MSLRHDFLDLSDLDGATLRHILELAKRLKTLHAQGKAPKPLQGQQLGMIFEKNSTRTRVSFEVGMRQLGGDTLYLSRSDLQLGRGESIADTAKVLSRYIDAIMIRCLYHETLLEMAENADVPVINGLTNRSHPCQIMADILTFEEHRGPVAGKTLAWVGDCNNVSQSMIHAAARLGFTFRLACPKRYAPAQEFIDWADANSGNVEWTADPLTAVEGADCVFTDTWVSMGDEEPEIKKRAFAKYQITAELMAHAKPDALFMHCLPAYRGEEVTAEVIDGPQSVVFDEAENRMHVQKAILLWCLGKDGAL